MWKIEEEFLNAKVFNIGNETPMGGTETSCPIRREVEGSGLLAGLPEDRSLRWTPSLRPCGSVQDKAVVSPGHNGIDHAAGRAVSKHAFHHP